MRTLTTAECIHIFKNSTLQSGAFTPEAMTATYVAALAALQEKAERENPAPLTPEQIRQMRGQPVWCPEAKACGIITMDTKGPLADKPFLYGYWLPDKDAVCGTEFSYNIEKRGLTIYPYKPLQEGGGTHDPGEDCPRNG